MSRIITIAETLVPITDIIDVCGMTRDEVVSMCEVRFNHKGQECVLNSEAMWLSPRCLLLAAYEATWRFAWANYDRSAEVRAAFKAGAESVPWDHTKPDHANLYAQQEAGVKAREKFAKEHPEVGAPGSPYPSEKHWFEATFPDEVRKLHSALNSLDFARPR